MYFHEIGLTYMFLGACDAGFKSKKFQRILDFVDFKKNTKLCKKSRNDMEKKK